MSAAPVLLAMAALVHADSLYDVLRAPRPQRSQSLHFGRESRDNATAKHLGDPPQCLKERCPPSKVLADRGSYKKVFFPVAPYAKKRMLGKKLVPAASELYKTLDDYYKGNNDKDMKMPMTQPAILRVDVPEDTMFNPQNFTLFFFLDPSLTVQDAPKPKDTDIEVLDVNEYVLYIRTFSGYPVTYGDWMKELLQLAADVEADGERYKKGWYYFATYSHPGEMTGRVNEVQLLQPHGDMQGL